jgi:hypothetical protein
MTDVPKPPPAKAQPQLYRGGAPVDDHSWCVNQINTISAQRDGACDQVERLAAKLMRSEAAIKRILDLRPGLRIAKHGTRSDGTIWIQWERYYLASDINSALAGDTDE